jgi:hypothetical protein
VGEAGKKKFIEEEDETEGQGEWENAINLPLKSSLWFVLL